MRKSFILIFTTILLLSLLNFNVLAERIHQVMLDPLELGVKQISGNDATAEDYFADGVINLRCNYSTGDSQKTYLWFASSWTGENKKQPSSVFIGKYKMADIKSVDFVFTTDMFTVNNTVSLTKDAEGKHKVASVNITEGPGKLNYLSVDNASMTITDISYEGDVYLHIEYSARMFIANVVLTVEGPEVTPEPTLAPTEAPTEVPTADATATASSETSSPTLEPLYTPTPQETIGEEIKETKDKNNDWLVYVVMGAVVLVIAVVVFVILRKKK